MDRSETIRSIRCLALLADAYESTDWGDTHDAIGEAILHEVSYANRLCRDQAGVS